MYAYFLQKNSHLILKPVHQPFRMNQPLLPICRLLPLFIKISKHMFFDLQNKNNELEVASNADNAAEMDQAHPHPAPKSTRLAIPPAV